MNRRRFLALGLVAAGLGLLSPSAAQVIGERISAKFVRRSPLSIPDSRLTDVTWDGTGLYGRHVDRWGLLEPDGAAVLLPSGEWDVRWVLTYGRTRHASPLKGALQMWYGGGHPEGESVGEWTAIVDGNELSSVPGQETTLVGWGIVSSDGTNRIKLVTQQGSGGPLSLSGEPYECQLHVLAL